MEDSRLDYIPVTIDEGLIVVRVCMVVFELLHFNHVLGLIEDSVLLLF